MGIKKNAFLEAINDRGLEQLGEVFSHLVKEQSVLFPLNMRILVEAPPQGVSPDGQKQVLSFLVV